ncbi:MAG: AsmA family protein [Rikenellaceae bacterium]
MKKLLKIFTIILVAIVVLAGGTTIALNKILTPQRISSIVTEALQPYVNSKIVLRGARYSFLSTFPRVTFTIDSLMIPQMRDSLGELIYIRRARLAVNPVAFFNDEIVVRNFAIKSASIHLFRDDSIRPIQHFNLPDSTSSSEPADTLNSFDIAKYNIDIQRVHIDSMNIVIDDRTTDFYSSVQDFSLDLAMKKVGRVIDLDARLGLDSITIRRKGGDFIKDMRLRFNSMLHLNRDSMRLTFEKADIKVNNIGMRSSGVLQRDTARKSLIVDIKAGLRSPSLAEFINVIPKTFLDSKEKITTDGTIKLAITAQGEYSATSLPSINANVVVNDATAKYESRKLSLEDVDCDADMYIDFNKPESSYAVINNLHLNTTKILDLTVKGRVNNLIKDQSVDIHLLSDIDFNRFTEVFPLRDGIKLQGSNTSDLKAQFTVSDMVKSNYGKLFLTGKSTFNNVDIYIDGSKFRNDSTATGYLSVAMERGTLLFGDKVKENNSRTLLSTINFTDFGYKDRNGNYTLIKDLKLTAGANFDRKTQKVNGVGGRVEVKNVTAGVENMMDVVVDYSDLTLTISPEREDRKATVVTKIKSSKVIATEQSNNTNMTLSTIDADLTAVRQRAKDWILAGDLGFEDFSIFTDIFPLQSSIKRSKVHIEDRTITLSNTPIKMGESRLMATGEIHNLIRKLFKRPNALIKGSLAIKSPLLNVSELIEATNKSVLFTADSTATTSVTAQPATDSLATSELLLVPKRVDFNFNLDVGRIKYDDVDISDIKGQAAMQQGILTLKELSLKVAGADANTSVVYSNVSDTTAHVNFALNMQSVDIKKIGDILPTIKTMMPATESMEGVVDFDFKANSDLNQDITFDLNTLIGALTLSGQDLVLMDSKTFAQLSKTLMFKNKERNLIENLHVNVIADKSKVEVLPFLLTMDRYSAIIGGEQVIGADFSVDYNYQISILKSPLPFKAGVDVFGNLEDFDFKVTKAKLKNTNFEEVDARFKKFYDSIVTLPTTSPRVKLTKEQRIARRAARQDSLAKIAIRDSLLLVGAQDSLKTQVITE